MRGEYRPIFISIGLLILFMNLPGCVMMPKHISESDIPHDRWSISLYQPDEDLSFIKSNFSDASPGLLTAVIDSSRNSRAEKAYSSVLAFAENHSLNDLFLSRIQESNVLRLLSRNGEIIPSNIFDSSEVDENGYILVMAVIELTHDLSTLVVRLEFKEYAGSVGFALNGIGQKYHYVYRLESFDEEKSRSEFAEQWVELGEARFVEMVETGIVETIEMMKTYLANPNPELLSDKEYYIEGYRPNSWRSHIWGGDEDVVWLIKGNAQQFVFATPKEFIQEADWDKVGRP